VRWPGIVHRCYRNSRSATAVTAAMLSVHSVARTWQARVDAYVALSEFARARFVTGGIPASRVVVKPNFLDPDPGVGMHRGEYALFVGRLSAEKGVAVLLQAWARLERRMALKVVGTGPFSPPPDCGQAAVEWLGRASPRRVLELMKEARFLLFPSEVYENCPMTLIQAFATGLPVVASGHGSIGEMVRDRESGRHFQPGDPVDLARTIAALIDRPETLEAMMRQSRQAYEARYTADRNYDRLRQVYDVAFEHARAAA
jgi:glycosyltransferase involved in cell wall biosynthesis